MLRYDYIIIGGGIAGTTAAEIIRKIDSNARIAILEEEKHVLYSRVFLPKYCRNEITREKVMLRSLGDYEKERLDLYTYEKAESIDFVKREIKALSGNIFSYGKLLIASGGSVRASDFEKEFADKIFRLQTLEDAERIRDLVLKNKVKKVLIVGGGFIALEFAGIFLKFEIETSLVIKSKYFWEDYISEAGGADIAEIFRKKHIEYFTDDEIFKIERAEEGGIVVVTRNRKRIRADRVALAIGISRNIELGRGVLDIGDGIKVDENLKVKTLLGMEEAGMGVYAAGDVIEYFDEFSGKERIIGNWNHSFLTGHIAGTNMAQGSMKFRSVASYSIKSLDQVFTFLGDTDKKWADETVVRRLPLENKYTELFIKNGKLIGAILINTFQQKPLLTKWIEEGKDLTQIRSALADPNSNLEIL